MLLMKTEQGTFGCLSYWRSPLRILISGLPLREIPGDLGLSRVDYVCLEHLEELLSGVKRLGTIER